MEVVDLSSSTSSASVFDRLDLQLSEVRIIERSYTDRKIIPDRKIVHR